METLNTLGRLWLSWSMFGLIDAVIVLVTASLVWLAVKHRTSPGLGCWLFLLVTLKLLLPVKLAVLPISIPWSLQTQAEQLLYCKRS